MKTPTFPGMNPFLEQVWEDFHAAFITYLRDRINPTLPGDLRARMERRVFVGEPDARGRAIRPDVHVVETANDSGGVAAMAEPVAEPLTFRLPQETREPFIQIVDANDHRVVTVLELLSPANKRLGAGRNEYLRKQRECLDARVSLVEIDLLRGGEPTTLGADKPIPANRPAAYHVSVAYMPGACLQVYPIGLTAALPRVRVPLRTEQEFIELNLQAVLAEALAKGNYDDLDYAAAIEPTLSADARAAFGMA